MDKLALGIDNLGDIRGTGNLGLENTFATAGPDTLNRLLTITIGLLTFIAVIWFLIQVITGAYEWMNSGGDKTALENARKKILNATIALSIIISAIFILSFLGTILNIPDILDPASIIRQIGEFLHYPP